MDNGEQVTRPLDGRDAVDPAAAEPAGAAVGGSDGAWFPLSHPQQGFWLLHTLGDAGADLNLPVWEHIRRPVDVDKLRAAVDLVVRRHSALRLVIRGTPEGPRQRFLNGHALEVPLVDLAAHPDPQAEVESLMRAESRQVFDFTAPPVRARLYRLADDHYCFFLNVHHIIADGLSLGLLMRELRAVHEGLVSGRPAELPELTASYESYVRDQQRWLAGPESAATERYWREQLAGPLPRLRLADGVAEPGGRIDFVAFHLDAPTTAAVTAAARRLRVTVNTFLVSGYVTVLRLLTGDEDIIVGIPFSGRYAKELDDLFGLFVNSLALRVRTAGLVTFANVVRQVERQSLGALAHSRYPFNVLVEKLNPRRDSGRNPIFSTAFQYARFLPPAYQTAGLDLGLYGRPDGDRIELRASYHARRLTAARVNAVVAGFGLVVAEGAADPGRPVAELGRRMAQAGLAPAGPDGASAGGTPRGRLQDLLAARVRDGGGR